jgi:DNA-binding GntR family transcriptional regulator
MEQINRPQSLTSFARDKIRRGIITGEYAMGAPLYEKVLAERYGVSKTPVRESLVQLQNEGLVVVIPHSGTFVFDPTLDDIAQMCECRDVLETAALKLAVKRNRSELVSALAVNLTKMRKAMDARKFEKYRDLDAEFHRLFFDYSNNACLGASYTLIEGKIAALRVNLVNPLPNETNASLADHQCVVAALESGNIGAAHRELSRHILRSKELFRTVRNGGFGGSSRKRNLG